MRPRGSPEELERRRQRAIALLGEGLAPVEVARRVGVDRRSVRRWKAAHRQGGRQALAARPCPGRPPKLDPPAKEKLEAVLKQGPRAAGFHSDAWTCDRVAEVILANFEVSYHPGHIARILKSMGWSPQRAEKLLSDVGQPAVHIWTKDEASSPSK